jgi:hypothetical protein
VNQREINQVQLQLARAELPIKGHLMEVSIVSCRSNGTAKIRFHIVEPKSTPLKDYLKSIYVTPQRTTIKDERVAENDR